MASGWQIDEEVLLALRLDQIEQSINGNRLQEALLEAEELLDKHPNHPLGLFYAGQAALRLGAAHTARAALQHASRIRPLEPTLLSALSRAHLESGDLAQALETADAALSLSPESAEAWFIRALVLERLGQDAAESLARASALEGERYPLPLALTTPQWEQALTRARSLLPEAIQGFYDRIPVRWEEYPTPGALRRQEPMLSPLVGALSQGSPPDDDQDPWSVVPEAMLLYRGNLKYAIPPGSSLTERIMQALLNEALAWTGVPSEQLLTD